MLAQLVLSVVVLLMAYLLHKQKLRNGEDGLPFLGLFFDAIAPYDPSNVSRAPPSSQACLEPTSTMTVKPTKSKSVPPVASESLASTQVASSTSPSFVDERPADSAADIAPPPAMLEPFSATQLVNHSQAEHFDVGGLQPTAFQPKLQQITNLILSEDAAQPAGFINDFEIKTRDSEKASVSSEFVPVDQHQKGSSRRRLYCQEEEAAVPSEDSGPNQQANMIADQLPQPIESNSNFKMDIDGSKMIVDYSTGEIEGITNEQQPVSDRGFESSPEHYHRHQSQDSVESPIDDASPADVPSDDIGETGALTNASPTEKRHHRCRSASASVRRSSHRCSLHRRSTATGEESATVKNSFESQQEAVNHDTNEDAAPSDQQPKRRHHHRSASCRHRTRRSSSRFLRRSKSKDAVGDAEAIKDSATLQTDTPKQQDVEQ